MLAWRVILGSLVVVSFVCGRDAVVCSCAELLLGFLGCDQVTLLQSWH